MLTRIRWMVAALTVLLSSSPVWSQWGPGGTPTFVQGSTYQLYFQQPGYPGFESADLVIHFSPLVFEPLARLPGDFESALQFTVNPVLPAPAGTSQISMAVVPLTPPFNLTAGTLFGIEFRVRDNAPTGTTVTSASFAIGEDPPASFVATFDIAAVPEPQTWAMLLAGLGWIVFRTRARLLQHKEITASS